MSCQKKKAQWRTLLWLLSGLLLLFFPELIIEFNYSGSVFLICFPHFLGNWLCIPIFFLHPHICWHYAVACEYHSFTLACTVSRHIYRSADKYIANKCSVQHKTFILYWNCSLFYSKTLSDVLTVISFCQEHLLSCALVTEVKMKLKAHMSKLHCVLLPRISTWPRYRGPGDIDLIFCLFVSPL